jgi:MFS transporter, DHA1 family, inner membrane transport protein
LSQRPNYLWAFLFGNFLIGTGVLVPAGMANQLGTYFDKTPSEVGLLMLISGIVVGLGAPIFAALTARLDRRGLLVSMLLLYAVGHGLSALLGDFTTLAIVRAFTIVSAAVFTPQAAACMGALLPANERPSAIAFIFIGWSVAAVVGVPLSNLIAEIYGWQWVYVAISVLSFCGAIAVGRTLPMGLVVPPLNLASWKQALTTPALLAVFLVTLISFVGQFVIFSYAAPILAKAFAATPVMISIAFAVMGLAGLIGNSLAARFVGRLGVPRVIAISLLIMCCGYLVFALAFGNIVGALLGMTLVGLGTFSSNSLQQSRLASLVPAIASATIALNTSVVYLGQALGTLLGGKVMAVSMSSTTAWLAFGLVALALVVSVWAERVKVPSVLLKT